jgi:hypothetical protein
MPNRPEKQKFLRRETTEMATLLPYTGREFLDSLDDGREVWIYGHRVTSLLASVGELGLHMSIRAHLHAAEFTRPSRFGAGP